MRVAVVSGKGGTGKTTISTSLALRARERGLSCLYLDCDVEEPNGWLFLKPREDSSTKVERLRPLLDHAACTACGACVEFCHYNALTLLAGELMLFKGLCHSCGGCSLICPEGAIGEFAHPVGELRRGDSEGLHVREGRLLLGEVDSPGVIRAVLDHQEQVDLEIVDGPPGAACPLVSALSGADYVLLVCESTPFGVHDFRQLLRAIHELQLPHAAVLNRSGFADHLAEEACRATGVPLLARIPDDHTLRQLASQGDVALQEVPALLNACDTLLDHLLAQEAGCRH